MPTQLTKSQLIEKIAEDTELGKKDVKAVIESLVTVGHKELKKAGVFLVPGFAKFVVIKKPATKERKGINPFTKEPTPFPRLRWEREVRLWRTADVVPASCRRVI
jgi:nucleoid DNA-binding protein